jgi:opacity protein-like surface antigen
MRRLVLAAMMVVTAHGALAADMPDLPVLRGFVNDGPPAPRTTWQGFYVGGQADFSRPAANLTNVNNGTITNFEELVGPVIGFPLPVFPTLGIARVSDSGFGGFAGYNAQWDDAVVSLEGSYTHTKLSQFYSGIPQFANAGQLGGFNYTSHAYSFANVNVHDFGTVRMRGGWSVGCFLPYFFAGVALGSGDTVHVVSAQVTRAPAPGQTQDPNAPLGVPLTSQTETATNRLFYGHTFGLGSEVLLFGNLFARGEYEYVRFTTPVDVTINSVRVGLGYKF